MGGRRALPEFGAGRQEVEGMSRRSLGPSHEGAWMPQQRQETGKMEAACTFPRARQRRRAAGQSRGGQDGRQRELVVLQAGSVLEGSLEGRLDAFGPGIARCSHPALFADGRH